MPRPKLISKRRSKDRLPSFWRVEIIDRRTNLPIFDEHVDDQESAEGLAKLARFEGSTAKILIHRPGSLYCYEWI